MTLLDTASHLYCQTCATAWRKDDVASAHYFRSVRPDEIVANGGFDSDTIWIKAGGWVIAGGVASTPTDSIMYQVPVELTGIFAGVTYAYSFLIAGRAVGALNFRLGGAGVQVNGNGTFTGNIVAGSTNGRIQLESSGSWDGTVDDVSAIPITSDGPFAIGAYTSPSLISAAGNIMTFCPACHTGQLQGRRTKYAGIRHSRFYLGDDVAKGDERDGPRGRADVVNKPSQRDE